MYNLISKIRNNYYNERIRKRFNHASQISVGLPFFTNCPELISIGDNFICQKYNRIEAFYHPEYDTTVKIIIGNNVQINWFCHIGAINRIEIHDDVLIGSHVLITDHAHGKSSVEELSLPPSRRPLWSKGPVIIENNVWIGEGVVILPNVTIGKNSIIGANSVVTQNIPMNSVVVGNPAKIVKRL